MRELQLFTDLPEGTTVIEAAAGTGKTFAIAALFIRLVLERQLPVESILTVTFTEAATEELRDRVRGRLGMALDAFYGGDPGDDFLEELVRRTPDRQAARNLLTVALASFDSAPILTIHGFCARILQEFPFECGTVPDTGMLKDQSSLIREVVEDAWRHHFYGADPLYTAHALRHGLKPELLEAVVKQVIDRTGVSILPESAPVKVVEEVARCRDAFRKVQVAWPIMREELVTLLAESPALKRNSYNMAGVEQWAAAIDRYTAGADPLALPEKIGKFTGPALAAATRAGKNTPEHRFFPLCEQLLAAVHELERQYDHNLLAMKVDLARRAREELGRLKELRNLRSFDDLLYGLDAALGSGSKQLLVERVRRRYRAALIDEFQDTDKLQYRIFTELFTAGKLPLVLIGDPKQAIYSFRGADLHAYLEAVKPVAAEGFTLTRNWRSTPELLAAVNALFAASRPFLLPEIEYRPVSAGRYEKGAGPFPHEPPLVLWWYQGEPDRPLAKTKAEQLVAVDTAREVARLLRSVGEAAPIGAGEIAVLVRKNHQGKLVQRALKDLGIPSVMHGTESLFRSREVRELHILLLAVADPANETRLRGALATDLLGWSAVDLAQADEESNDWSSLLERIRAYHNRWLDQGVMAMAAELLSAEQVRPRLLAHPDGDRRLTNLVHALELLHHASLEGELGLDGVVAWLAERIAEPPDMDEYQLRLETDESCVQIVTIHRSKGLEYPVVFVPFAWEGVRRECPAIFHDRGGLVLDLGSQGIADSRRKAREEQFAEDLRLLYVAVTRAKFRCYLAWGLFSDADSSPLAYLLHRPALIDDADIMAVSAVHMQSLDKAALQHDLDSLVERSGHAVAIVPPPDADVPLALEMRGDAQALNSRTFHGTIDRSWRIASFTGLISGKPHAELPDRDAVSGPAAITPPEAEPAPQGVFSFPKGAQAGTCLHAILERVAFNAFQPETVRQLVAEQLARHGLAVTWEETIAGMVENVLHLPLLPGHDPLLLARLEPGSWQSELEFMLPLAPVGRDNLARVFRRHSADPQFPAMIEELGFTRVEGLLRGFIDLVFRFDGRYYLIDWKSNHLGHRSADYAAGNLQLVMNREYYTLQYHLYLVALHRMLALRMPGYDYDRHCGGVFYLFLRGMNRTFPPGSGVFHHRPDRRLIEDLTETICGGACDAA